MLACSVLLLVGATEVTGAARAGADSLPNCATTPETTTEGCGYYINQSGVVGGTSVLAGESSASPTDIAIGGPLDQTATVMANPGVYDVTMSGYGPITSYSPQGGSGITVSVVGSQVTWTQPVLNGFTAFSAGQTFTLDSTASSLGVSPCTLCASLGVQWNYGIGGNPSGYSQTPYLSVGAGGTPPTASFTDTADTTVPGAVDFDASASMPSPGATLESYTWNFGDGSAPMTTASPITTHTYTTPGSQQVTLTVTDSTGQTGSFTKSLQFPIPAFSYVPDASNPKALDFDASASAGSGGTAVATYTWNFGDGSQPVSIHSPTYTYTYAAGGVYTVTLSVTDTDGQTSPLLAKQVTVAAYDVNSVGDGPAKDTTQPACDTGSTVVINATTVPECTLRAAIQAVDAAGRGAITFNLPTGVTPTLAPATPLPTITAANASIDASTVTGGYLKIDGTALDRTTGIGLHVSGANDTIRGMDLENVATGILVDAAGGNDTIAGSTIGDTSNTATTPVGVGISVTNSSNDLIGGLTVADRVYIDKASTGIYIGGTSTGDKVFGDYIGVDSLGGYAGDLEPVFINSASGNFIGGPSASPGQAPGNIIDGETLFTQAAGSSVDSGSTVPATAAYGTAGVAIAGYTNGANNNSVQGNIIGLVNGGTALPECLPSDTDFWQEPLLGVVVDGRALGNTIGGTSAGAGNVITGAANAQVDVDGTRVSGTSVEGNLIGTDITGQTALPDVCGSPTGVSINGATTTTVGIAGAGRNVITAQNIGVLTSMVASKFTGPSGAYPGSGTTQITPLNSIIQGNVIGPVADGVTAPTSTQAYGVALTGTGDTLGPNNQISDNGVGVQIGGQVNSGVNESVIGNQIGTDRLGTTALPNGLGVYVLKGTGTRIGIPGQKANTISGNLENLALIQSATVQNNLIGTTSLGNAAIAPYAGTPSAAITAAATFTIGGTTFSSPSQAALVTVGAQGGLIGGPNPGSGNVISGSPGADGLDLYGPAVVQGNKIGVGADGTTAVPNAGYGILNLAGQAGAIIGGSPTAGVPAGDGMWPADPVGGNTVADNKGTGIGTGGGPVLSNLVYDNDGGIATVPGSSGPVIVGANLTGQNGTTVLVALPKASPGAIVQIYQATDCGTLPEGRTLLQTDTISTGGTLTTTVPLLAVGTPLVATLTTATNANPANDVTTEFTPSCSLVVPGESLVTPTTVQPNATATATATGFTPGETVNATVHSNSIDVGQVVAAPDGSVNLMFTVPADLAAGTHYLVLVGQTSGHTTVAAFTVTASSGYRLAAADGQVLPFGGAGLFGSAESIHLATPIVGIAATSDGGGYWLAAADGGVFAYGDAAFYGSMGGRHLNSPIVGIAATSDGGGYWLVAADGGVFAFGDAGFHGSMGDTRLNAPVVGIAAGPTGGYWLAAADGGVFAFGDAGFHGSMGDTRLNAPVVGIAAGPTGGYWLAASDGGVFSFDASFYGSMGGKNLNGPIVGVTATSDGSGYWLVGADGGIFNFGHAVFSGAAAIPTTGAPIVGIAPTDG
ncbi:MAG: beta strand repeat-containing protein [Acidimicrobiales bacterium]